MSNDHTAKQAPQSTPPQAREYFFCGIGGSGMLPLAAIVKGLGAKVGGSDRSYDQGRTPEKFAWLAGRGFALFPQDGSGMVSGDQVLIASAAVEDSVPEVARSKELGCDRMTRAELLSSLFNASPVSLGIAGTSGKSTTTAMLGWILEHSGRAPTIMNGAVMKNFVSEDEPFASAVVGNGEVFISEIDESDGSIALYNPSVSVLLNVSLDHKSMEELRVLFGDYLARADVAVFNADDEECLGLLPRVDGPSISFGLTSKRADISVAQGSIVESETGIGAQIIDHRDGATAQLALKMPGIHNLANALAAITGAMASGISQADAVAALNAFTGLARRFDVIGVSESGVTVIDDFGHNPEKCRATLRTLKAHEGRVIAFFQPHGYGPLRQMGHELAETFAQELGADDITILCDPVYYGGTVDRSEGSERIIGLIEQAGGKAQHIATREDCANYMAEIAQSGDRIVIMGARDDTLTLFAWNLLERLSST